MAKCFVVGSTSGSLTQGVTDPPLSYEYARFGMCATLFNNTVAEDFRNYMGGSGSVTECSINCWQNTATVDVTIELCKNNVEQGLKIVIPAGLTGNYKGTGGPVAFVEGDSLTWRLYNTAAGGTGAASINCLVAVIDTPGDGVLLPIICSGSGSPLTTLANPQPYWNTLGGRLTPTVTEANIKPPIQLGGTLRRLFAVLGSTYTKDGTVTHSVRKNGVTTAMSAAWVSGSAAGALIVDTVNTDNVSAGDILSHQMTPSVATGNAVISNLGVTLTRPTSEFFSLANSQTATTSTASASRWYPIGGMITADGYASSIHNARIPFACTLKEFQVVSTVSTTTSITYFYIVVNGVDAGFLGVAAGFVGTTTTVLDIPLSVDDLVHVRVVRGAGNFSFMSMSASFTQDAAVVTKGVFLGGSKINNLNLGGTAIQEVYLGSNKIH